MMDAVGFAIALAVGLTVGLTGHDIATGLVAGYVRKRVYKKLSEVQSSKLLDQLDETDTLLQEYNPDNKGYM